ncbi:uncharacterized protein N7487_001788 [Penicillium crustosum]|uniref:uncharacterized protein n=1 Tax=Penicillium crustosum TaxID=36656 RepID=UPI0023857C71|nr:uncharacterized protein N7487_001788 [Penicillium crustosum]KAJ5418238.1 hypothetical protein N7487_001788 [Penicillium crustosum]
MAMPSPATKLGTTNTISKIMIRRSDNLRTCSPLARLVEADRVSNTTIPSMHIDWPPKILMMIYQATGVLNYDAADPFDDRSKFSDAFSEVGVATSHRRNILENDEAEGFHEPQALLGIRGLLAVMSDRGYEDGSISTDGNAGGDDDDDTGWRWTARCALLRFVAYLTKTPIPQESDEELSTLVPRIIFTLPDPAGYINTCLPTFKGGRSQGKRWR